VVFALTVHIIKPKASDVPTYFQNGSNKTHADI
jgi:hypothetical protein